MAKQHRRDHRHHTERRRSRRAHRHHPGDGRAGPEPGGPLTMTGHRTLMAAVAIVLVLGLIAFGVLWALIWG